MSEDAVTRILPGDAGPGPELEKRILREMQRAFRRRAQAAVLSLTAAALALACLPEEQRYGLIRLMRMGGVWLAAAFCLASLADAWSFCRESLRLRALGVPRVKGVRAHAAWSFAGASSSSPPPPPPSRLWACPWARPACSCCRACCWPPGSGSAFISSRRTTKPPKPNSGGP